MGIFSKSGGKGNGKSGSKGAYGKGYGKGSASSNERKYTPRTEAQSRREDRKLKKFK
ncbi:MAG: hypothetical protein P8Q23_08415 [Paracoccaceae bacterium]|nr:hypothetical protein [Paracoccaceae bacterium]